MCGCLVRMCAAAAAVAAAEDGTVVLDGRPETGRRLIWYRRIFRKTRRLVARCLTSSPSLLRFRSGGCVFLSFCFWSLRLQQLCPFERQSKPSAPTPSTRGQHSVNSVKSFCSLPHRPSFSVTQKIWAKISIFFKKGNLLIHEATVLKVSSVLFSCSKFFFLPKKELFDQTFFFLFACGSKIKQYVVFFIISYSFKKNKKQKKSPCSILQIVTPFVG